MNKQITSKALLIICFLFLSGKMFSQQGTKIQLTISPSTENPEVLLFILDNLGNDTLSLKEFNLSPRNKPSISNLQGDLLTSPAACGTIYSQVKVLPNSTVIWKYAPKDKLKELLLGEAGNLLKGKYKINWTVEEVKAETYIFEFK